MSLILAESGKPVFSRLSELFRSFFCQLSVRFEQSDMDTFLASWWLWKSFGWVFGRVFGPNMHANYAICVLLYPCEEILAELGICDVFGLHVPEPDLSLVLNQDHPEEEEE